MYAEFYRLATRPFQLTPDARFFFESTVPPPGDGLYGLWPASRRRLHHHHRRSRRRERPFSSTICWRRSARTALSPPKIVTSQLGGDDLLHMVAAGFGIAKEGLAKGALLQRISEFRAGPTSRRQARAADRRRGAEPVLRSARGIAHAVQHRRRQDDGVAELPARPAAIPRRSWAARGSSNCASG